MMMWVLCAGVMSRSFYGGHVEAYLGTLKVLKWNAHHRLVHQLWHRAMRREWNRLAGAQGSRGA